MLKLRKGRGLRARIAAKAAKPKVPRTARSVLITEKGLTIEGTEFPWYIAEDVEVDVLGFDGFSRVNVGIYADEVVVGDWEPLTAAPLRGGVSLTINYETGR